MFRAIFRDSLVLHELFIYTCLQKNTISAYNANINIYTMTADDRLAASKNIHLIIYPKIVLCIIMKMKTSVN